MIIKDRKEKKKDKSIKFFLYTRIREDERKKKDEEKKKRDEQREAEKEKKELERKQREAERDKKEAEKKLEDEKRKQKEDAEVGFPINVIKLQENIQQATDIGMTSYFDHMTTSL